MTTLITGGTGRTGGALAKLLHEANRPFLVATRSPPSASTPSPYKTVEFDFSKPDTYANPFTASSSSSSSDSDPGTGTGKGIDRIYLVPPPMIGPDPVNAFIDYAITRGVKKFVLLSTSLTEPGGPGGEIHQHLVDVGVDLTVLRPTWYFQNFTWAFIHATIKEHDQTYSATAEGRIPFVSTEDVGQAAFDALTAEKSPNKVVFVLGPQLFSYAQLTTLLSTTLGRPITHQRLTPNELTDKLTVFGLPPPLAQGLAAMESAAAAGSEEAVFNGPAEKFVGKRTLGEFFEENKGVWMK